MSQNETTPVWLLMALVSKDHPGGHTSSGMMGWRVMASEDEARGSFLRSIEREKPGFSLDDLTVVRLPEAAMRMALGVSNES
jgi:hypothetical protein